MNFSPANIESDPALSDGVLNGFDAAGELVVSLQYMPVFKRLAGNEEDERQVTLWRVSPGGARRVAAIGAWNSCRAPSHPTVGNA